MERDVSEAERANVRLRKAEARDEGAIRALMQVGGMGLASDWQEAMVAVGEDDRPLGYLRVQQTELGPHVAPVAVFPYWQGQGIGRILMEDALERYGMLKLVARGEAADFYRKLGYREVSLEEISGDLEEDCEHCPDRESCQPIAFMLEKDASGPGADGVEEMLEQARRAMSAAAEHCDSCSLCVERCELLAGTGWDVRAFCEEGLRALEGVDCREELQPRLAEYPGLYRFVRTCLGCNRCTARCPQGLAMSSLRAPWRNILRTVGAIVESETVGLEVDRAWDIFSIFRATQGIGYSDLPCLEAEPIDADAVGWTPASNLPKATSLFFPGCTLCTYAPELTRAAFSWLEEREGPCLLATQCCASTLEGIGEGARADAWKRRVLEAARSQGVRQVVTVCPGCQVRLAPVAAEIAPDIEFVPLARLLADAGVRVQVEALAGCELPVSVVDSCQDRIETHGPAIRELFGNVDSVAFPAAGKDAFCCGASGSVNSIDPQFVRGCTRHQLDRAVQVGAGTLITACPTCAYTYAFEQRTCLVEGDASWEGLSSLNYLEAVFGMRINWPAVFDSLETLWTGEHAAWALGKLFP